MTNEFLIRTKTFSNHLFQSQVTLYGMRLGLPDAAAGSAGRPSPVFRSLSPGPGQMHQLRLHCGLLLAPATTTADQAEAVQAGGARQADRAQAAVLSNLHYSLDQAVLAGDREQFGRMVDWLVVGPESLTQSELDTTLAVNTAEFYTASRRRRVERLEGGETSWRREPRNSSPTAPPPRAGRGTPATVLEHGGSLRSRLEQQFTLYSRFAGGCVGSGRLITLRHRSAASPGSSLNTWPGPGLQCGAVRQTAGCGELVWSPPSPPPPARPSHSTKSAAARQHIVQSRQHPSVMPGLVKVVWFEFCLGL